MDCDLHVRLRGWRNRIADHPQVQGGAPMRDKAGRDLIPTIGGREWICVVLTPWGMVHNVFVLGAKSKAELELRLKRGEI
jgi:hypothetical protein